MSSVDPEISALFEQARNERDPELRKRLLLGMQRKAIANVIEAANRAAQKGELMILRPKERSGRAPR
jgi:hypothetical protein